MRLHLSVLLTISLAGCAAGASKIDESRLDEVRIGQTTRSQVLAAFGRPTILSRNIDGSQTAAYVDDANRSSTLAVVPLMAVMAGSPGANVSSVIFYFDAAGVLSHYRRTRVNAPAAAVAAVEAPATVNNDNAPKAVKQTRGNVDPWNIRIEASGQRENR